MNLLDSGSSMGSVIFWGPPGCGKTTLARLLAKKSGSAFKELSATNVGIKEVRDVFEEAKGALTMTGRKTILFLDEVHRFNRAQQDIFLPYLIGATTENPSFKINGALLSRCRVFVLERLTDDDIKQIIARAVSRASSINEDTDNRIDLSDDVPVSSAGPSIDAPSSSQLGSSQASTSMPPPATPALLPFPAYPHITPQVLSALVSLSTGDARTALSLLALVLSSPRSTPTPLLLDALRRSVIAGYDRTGDTHYDLISALHKSVRGGAGSAALYWLARMLRGGEDPLFVARRMVVCASEDIGLADPRALPLAMATYQACQVIGMPECRINLAHLVSYLAEAPKSTRSYMGYKRAEAAAEQDMTLPVPLGIRNAPTRLMEELGYSEGYRYNPDYAHPVHNQFLPDTLKDETFLLKEGDISDKTWSEEALKVWEREQNGGKEWAGRRQRQDNRQGQGCKRTGPMVDSETEDEFGDEDLENVAF
ncbi:P-loop containing nucleoside triphosphate hydrolase protein [Phellopilus nigrolimitatus]|nr:P-loop containing nucleoside triphosphate hydrolase protein [Phellopilus nigrolimitatus]